MKNWKQIAKDYYLERQDNATIFEKYNLKRTKRHYSQERVYEHLPIYPMNSICPYCEEKMSAKFVSKSAELCLSGSSSLSLKADIHELVEEETSKIYKQGYRHHSNRKAYQTSEGFRISAPKCLSCGHQSSTNCGCSNCNDIKVTNSIRAAEGLYANLESREKLMIDELSCADTLLFLQQLRGFTPHASSHLVGNDYKSDDNVDRSLSLFILGVLKIDRTQIPAGVRMTSINTYVSMLDQICFKPVHNRAISSCISDLKSRARGMYSEPVQKTELIEVWQNLALNEALNVLEHYCEIHELYYRPGEKTINMIKKSLRLYGLALTARYIYNSVWYSRKQANEAGYSAQRAFNQVYGNLGFWVDDPRARTYTARPFTRKDGVFSEPKTVSVFSEFFLEPHGVDYLTSAILKGTLE